MTQRKCGTCRFFEEGGIAASGWCRHPERQDLQHMVLVRKTELACRDGWDNDLWEPRPGINETYSETADALPQHSTRNGTTGDEGGTSDHEVSGERMARMNPSRFDEPRARTSSLESTRTTEQADERMTQSGTGRAHTAVLSERDAPADQRSDEIQNETISRRGFGDPQRWRRELAELRQDALARNDAVPPSPFEEPESAPVDEEAPRTDYQLDPGRDTSRPDTSVEPSVSSRNGGYFGSDDVGQQDGTRRRGPVEQSGMTEPFDVPEEGGNEPTIEHELGGNEPETNTEPESAFDDDVHPLNGASEPSILSTMTKCCRTCRDFRPSGGENVGWCNNPYAFSERQQVNAEDIACQGSFGNWWAPTDDWWMERADISHHSAPTPLVQQFIREMQQRQSENSTREGQRTYDTQKYNRKE